MSGIKTFVQTDMRVPPTEQNHVVRMRDMVEYVAGMTKAPVVAVLDAQFVGTYDNVALTLTQTTPAALVFDGVTIALGDRVLIAGQLDQTQNGIYVVTTLGADGTTAAVLTRADDLNSSTDIINGLIVPVTQGDINAGSRWKLSAGTIPYILDATNLVFSKEIVDFRKVAESTFIIEGDDSTLVYNFTHNFNSLFVTHELFDDATGDTVIGDFRRIGVNTAQVEFGMPLGVGVDFILIVRAEVDPQ